MAQKTISILFPQKGKPEYRQLTDTACHDLGLDTLCRELTDNEKEQRLILSVLSRMTADVGTAAYRQEVFDDIYNLPDMRAQMMKLLDKVQFLKDYGSLKKDYDKKTGLWDLLHRLDEISDYIRCVEAIRDCLGAQQIHSEGLRELRGFVEQIYQEACFAEMKKDIESLRADTSNLKSVTIGINLNDRFEADGVGIISVNKKPFKNSNIVSNFAQAMTTKQGLKEEAGWNGDMHYHQMENIGLSVFDTMENLAGMSAVSRTPFIDARIRNSVAQTVIGLPEDGSGSVTHYMDKAVTQMLSVTAKRLREVLSKYVLVTIGSITDLIPEFLYYIRFAEYIEKMTAKGYRFCKAEVLGTPDAETVFMQAEGIYNLKLASAVAAEEIVANDMVFDAGHMVYILTGANRGGKTTITQAVGQMYVLAQGGIYVPGDSFRYVPVDSIYTHFPADEDKTMDLGRLGEECRRFKEMYGACTEKSLLLLNETFSTTSFEEGYYIARDAVKAILSKGIRTIYNTHMHKLAFELDSLNDAGFPAKAVSLIVKSDGGNRSFRVQIAPPEGMSYAKDIAEKYGVTYAMLTGE